MACILILMYLDCKFKHVIITKLAYTDCKCTKRYYPLSCMVKKSRPRFFKHILKTHTDTYN